MINEPSDVNIEVYSNIKNRLEDLYSMLAEERVG